MSNLDATVRDVLCVADLTCTHLAVSTSVQLVLVELAQEFPAVEVQAGLELLVGERGGLVSVEEAYDSLVELVGGRKGAQLVALGRAARAFASSLRPASPSASREARASR